MGILFGLCAAVLYGTGDYIGGRAADGGDIRRVMLVAQLAALAIALVGAFVVHGELSGGDVAYGAAAGLVTVTGLGLLYRGLAVGRASVVAPLTAVVGALVPVFWGEVTGERPSAVALTGVVLAICAAGLVTRGRDEVTRESSGVGLAAAAGLALGVSFVLYASTSSESGLWPMLSARVVAVSVAGLAITVARGPAARVRLSASQFRLAATAGTFDAVGTVSLIAGVRTELAVLVAAVTALAPGFTVVCSRILREERFDRVQVVGVVLALVGLAVIAAG